MGFLGGAKRAAKGGASFIVGVLAWIVTIFLAYLPVHFLPVPTFVKAILVVVVGYLGLTSFSVLALPVWIWALTVEIPRQPYDIFSYVLFVGAAIYGIMTIWRLVAFIIAMIAERR